MGKLTVKCGIPHASRANSVTVGTFFVFRGFIDILVNVVTRTLVVGNTL